MYLREHTRVISVLFICFPISVYTGMPEPQMGAGMWQNRGVVFACNRSSRYLDVKTRRSGWVRLFLNHGPPTPNGHKQDTTPCMSRRRLRPRADITRQVTLPLVIRTRADGVSLARCGIGALGRGCGSVRAVRICLVVCRDRLLRDAAIGAGHKTVR